MYKLKNYEVHVVHGEGFPRTLHTGLSLEDALSEMLCMDDPEYTYDDEQEAEEDDILFSVHESNKPDYIAWINTEGESGTDLQEDDRRYQMVLTYL